jgi:glycosyltransferase involved in cell wall biosynthesis
MLSRPLTVLINAGPWLTVPPDGYGGIENVIATLIPELRRSGIRVVLSTVGASSIDVDEKLSAFSTPQFGQLTAPYNQVMGVAAAHMHHLANELAPRDDIDLVHDHLEAFGPTVLAAGHGLPAVLHTLHWDLAKHPELYGRFDGGGRVWVNGVSADQLARAPFRLRAHSLGHVHLASPLATDATRRPMPVKDDYLVLVARITAGKGQHVAARLAQRLGRELVLAGPVGPYPSAEALAADPHADRYPDVRYFRQEVLPHLDGHRVRWLGNIGSSERDDLVGRARATLVPLCWDEPGGTAVIESLALGTPVVGYRRGCLPELIDDKTGLLAEPGDEAELGRLLDRLDELDPDRCRAVAERRFSPRVMAAAYIDLYRQCLARSGDESAAQPGPQPVGGVANDAELLGDLNGRSAATGVAGVHRPVDREHLAHVRRQLDVDRREFGVL